MTMVWALSPLIGFFLAPLMGSLSDRCNLRLGRRRPFILLLSLGILIGLFLVPYGKDIGYWISGEELITQTSLSLISLKNDSFLSSAQNYEINPSDVDAKYITSHLGKMRVSETTVDVNMWAAVITIIGVILLDFDADTCQTPARAYLLDVSVPNEHSKSLSTFTIMAGLGGGLGYALGGINWNDTKLGDFFGGNIKTVFTIVTIIFVITVILSNTSFREVPLPTMMKDANLRPVNSKDIKKELARRGQFKISDKKKEIEAADAEKAALAKDDDDEEEVVSLTKYLKSIIIMPKSIRILCLTNLFCWMAHLCYCLYFTSFVGEEVFGGDPSVSTLFIYFYLYSNIIIIFMSL